MRRYLSISLPILLSTFVFSLVHHTTAHKQISDTIIISEVAWGGTQASANDEWIELFNRSSYLVDITGWKLQAADGAPDITLSGVVSPNGFFLLERTDESTVSTVNSDQLYTKSLENGGESLLLYDSEGNLVDTANGNGGAWPAGDNTGSYASMERVASDSADLDANWQTNDGIIRNGQDAAGNQINGTPRQPNSSWSASGPDLTIAQSAETQIAPGDLITYRIVLQNLGDTTAEQLTITNTLSSNLTFIAQSSVLAFTQHSATQLIWTADALTPTQTATITVTARSLDDFNGMLVNHVQASSQTSETITANNSATATTIVGSVVLINALHFDAYQGGDEAVELINVTGQAVDLSGWRLFDGSDSAELPPIILYPHQSIWITDDPSAFRAQFGFDADLSESDLIGNWPVFANNGDEVYLQNEAGITLDTLVYKDGETTALGWNGVSVVPYSKGSLAADGQILYRRQDEATGQPVADTNSAEDWANSAENIHSGRKVRYPGWDLDRFFHTAQITESAQVTISISPDNSHATVQQLIQSAQHSIQLEIFSITNLSIAQALFAAAKRGVSVDVLLEGSPPGGLLDQTRYICQQLEISGGNCWFSINEAEQDIFDRYRFLHAKFMLIDGTRAFISSDNFSGSSMPYDDFSDGTSGRRGVQITTDSSKIVAHLQAIWQNDFDTTNHHDIFGWVANHNLHGDQYGAPELGFIPDDLSGGFTYTVRYPHAVTFTDTVHFELIQSPENSLRSSDSLIGLINRAGAGDTLFVQQLDERPHWGNSIHTAVTDPNPRLEAYIDAARRGADVWIMLDSHLAAQYNDPTSNTPDNADVCTVAFHLSQQENLKLRCQLTNPTDLGIHNKMVLAEIDGQGYVHVGSINGTEQSSKGNREVAIQFQSDRAYAYLAAMFQNDWEHRVYLPNMVRKACGETNYLLISEVLYNPTGPNDLSEFIEIVNPTCAPVDLWNYAVGDAVTPQDFEDVRRFPPGTLLNPLETVVVAFQAVAFREQFGRNPDFEIQNSDPTVPDMLDDPNWDANATLRLSNSGDEVLLRDPFNHVIDVVTYGTGSYSNVIAAPLVSGANRSLERTPFWQDSNNGVNDMRESTPTPGQTATPY